MDNKPENHFQDYDVANKAQKNLKSLYGKRDTLRKKRKTRWIERSLEANAFKQQKIYVIKNCRSHIVKYFLVL